MQHRKTISVGICLVLISAFQAIAQQGDIDWNRARQLRQRSLQGEKLTEDEQSYLQRAIELRQKQKPQQRRPIEIKPPVGLKPLSDMTGDDRYKGQDGGLYGGGQNEPPQEHLEAALQQAKLIQPLDAQGKPSSDGKIGLISVGMSNTTQEFSAFVRLANADPAKSPDNDGTASRYTRSRRPVKLVYQEPQRGRRMALKREAAIKKLTRRQKLTLIRGATVCL